MLDFLWKTDLAFGRFSELEAYTCDEFEKDSWEVAIFNFNKRFGNFSAKGDSGSCIFNAEGKMVAFLHSGMPKGISNHVTFGAPAITSSSSSSDTTPTLTSLARSSKRKHDLELSIFSSLSLLWLLAQTRAFTVDSLRTFVAFCFIPVA